MSCCTDGAAAGPACGKKVCVDCTLRMPLGASPPTVPCCTHANTSARQDLMHASFAEFRITPWHGLFIILVGRATRKTQAIYMF